MNPLAMNESPAKAAAEEAEKAAQVAWGAFDAARKAAEDDGTIGTADGIARLERMRKDYEALARKADDARTSYVRDLERELAGGRGGKAVTARQPGAHVARKFLEAASTPEGRKAFDGTTGGIATPSFYDGSIKDTPIGRMLVRSLIPTESVDTGTVEYLRQTVQTFNAAAVAAHGAKPVSTVTVKKETEAVRVIAHVSEAIDRSLLMDFDALGAFVESQLAMGVLLHEEELLLSGDGLGANPTGILSTAGIGSVAKGETEDPAAAIYRAITTVRLQHMEPEAIVLHPSDWESIRLMRDADGSLVAGPVISADPNTLWGLPVVPAPTMPSGTALVGAFSMGAVIYDREATRVTWAETGAGDVGGNGDLFVTNAVRFRAEERLAIVVPRPAAFCEVTDL